MSSIEERVLRGACLLDRKVPGWEARVTRPLVMSSTIDCVLGQIYGTFYEGIRALKPRNHHSPTAHGFSEAEVGWEGMNYPALTEAWETLIAARRVPKIERVKEMAA